MRTIALTAAALLLAVCPVFAHSVTGTASWYGPGFEGRKQANGKPFRSRGVSAAMRAFPLGSRVRITSLRTHRHVDLTITDRGPYVPGRIVDLSQGAARRLGMEHDGIGRVRVERIGAHGKAKARIAHR